MTLLTCVSGVDLVNPRASSFLPSVKCPDLCLAVASSSVHVSDVFFCRPVNDFVTVTDVFVVVLSSVLVLRFHHVTCDVFCVSSAVQDLLISTVSRGLKNSLGSSQQNSKVPTSHAVRLCLSHDSEKTTTSSSSSFPPVDSRRFRVSFSSYFLSDLHQIYPSSLSLCVFSSALEMEMETDWIHQAPFCNNKQSKDD